jgi:hypothetical protein
MPIVKRRYRGMDLYIEHLQGAAPVTAANYGTFFVADRKYKVIQVQEVHGTASSSGTVTVEKLTGTQAKGAGNAILSSTISTAGAANTVNTGTLTATAADLILAAGDRLGLVNGGTLTSSADLTIAILMQPLGA